MSAPRAVAAVFRREVKLAWSAGAAAPLGFFIGAAALTPLAVLGGSPGEGASGEAMRSHLAVLAQVGPPMVWIAAALAALLVLERLFQADVEDGSFEQMLLSPAPLEALVAAKAAALWLAIGLPIALAGAPAALALQARPETILAIVLGLAIGMGGFIGAGLVGAAAAAGVKRAGVLIALLVLPFFAPPILFGAAATRAAMAGEAFGPAFALLAGVSIAALALGPVAAAAALRLHTD